MTKNAVHESCPYEILLSNCWDKLSRRTTMQSQSLMKVKQLFYTVCVWNFIFISTKHQWIWHSSTRACTKVCVMVVVCVQNIISYQVQSVSVEKLIKGYSQYLKVPAHHFIVLQAYDEHVKSCVLVYAFGFLSSKKIMLGSVVKKSFDCKESK